MFPLYLESNGKYLGTHFRRGHSGLPRCVQRYELASYMKMQQSCFEECQGLNEVWGLWKVIGQ